MVHASWLFTNTVASLALIGKCQGQTVVNVHHFIATDTAEAAFSGTSDDAGRQTWATGLATDWRTNCKTAYLSAHTNDYTLVEIRAQVLEVPTLFEHRLTAISDTTGLPGAGTIAAASDDLAASAVIRWRTVIGNRHGRGRTYLGPLNDTAVDSGTLGSTYKALADAYITAMGRYIGAGAGVTAGYHLAIYSRPYSAPNGAYTRRVPGVGLTVVNNTTDYNGTAIAVTSGVTDTTARVQRRREIGVGS